MLHISTRRDAAQGGFGRAVAGAVIAVAIAMNVPLQIAAASQQSAATKKPTLDIMPPRDPSPNCYSRAAD